jgi:hypothetical protein
MSTSERKIETNRQNCQKSTGPVTVEGKAIVGKNALRHGLYSKDAVITSVHLTEDQQEYDRLLESFVAELDPQTAFQDLLVERMVNCVWRLRRAVTAESAHISGDLARADRDYYYEVGRYAPNFLEREAGLNYEPAEAPADTFSRMVDSLMIPNEKFARNLLRYELRLDRQLMRSYQLFKRLKSGAIPDDSKRKGEKSGNP